MSQTLSTETINEYIDVLADYEISENKKLMKTPYYKSGIYNRATRIVLALSIAHAIDALLETSIVKKVDLDFEEEYNDEGGTYLIAMTRITYENDGEDEEETIYDTVEAEVLQLLTDEDNQQSLKDTIEQLCREVQSIDKDDHEAAFSFYDTQFNTTTSALGTFRERFPNQIAVIEKSILQKNVSDTSNVSKSKSKI